MPNLSQQVILPPRVPPGPVPHTWVASFYSALVRLWTQLIYVVNALSKVDTLANRPDTPDIDHIFFTASDTGQTFVAIDGEWEPVGPRHGSVAMGAAASTAAVTLSPAEPDTDYRVSLSPSYNAGGLWYTTKATTGFTVNAATAAPGGGGTIDWFLQRD